MVKHPLLNRVYGLIYGRPSAPEFAGGAPQAISTDAAPVRAQWHNGEKYPGGFGYTELLVADYWTLRQRSTQLFKTNLYARGIIRRLVTNIINTGLALEAMPDNSILGIGEDQLADWSETVENRFHLWERSPQLCDYKGASTFGKLQAEAKQAALISGDVLCVLIQDPLTGLPRVRLVDGDRVQSPFGAASEQPKLAAGHCIKHGVELDADGRHVAYWITQVDERQPYQLKSVRLPCYGATGRKLAWLVYGSDKLLDEVRGEPILSILLQSLREVDRYRDAVQRKAAINAVLAMFIKKDTEQMGSRPLMGGAQLRGQQTITSAGKTPRVYNFAEQIPGAVLDELAPGETPHGFSSTGTDEKFADFESAIVYAMAWCLNIPPEILTLSFASNYSASQAAVNEFKLYLNPVRAAWGDDFCQPIYIDWLLSETLAGRVKASGLLDAWRDPMQYDRLAAWLLADWTGAIKPSVDLMKQANGYEKLVEQGFITRDRATRETTGTKFSKNVKQLERENKALADANKPIAELKKPPAPPALPGAGPPGPKAPKDPNAPRKLRVVPKQESTADDTLVT
jgi:lambda family phage portal protein